VDWHRLGRNAQDERIVITRDGKPVALVVGVEGLDAEQVELGSSSKFWELINHRRQQTALTREQLEQKIGESGDRRPDTRQVTTVGRSSTRKKRSPHSSG